MLTALIETIKSFVSSFRKDTIYQYTDFVFNNINENLIPVMDTVIKSTDLDAIKKNNYFTNLCKNGNIKGNDNYKCLVSLQNIFKDISQCEGKLRKLIDDHLPDVITNKAMKAKDAAIVKIVKDLGVITNYTLDLMYYIIADEKVSDLPRIKFKRIREGGIDFVELIKVYGKDFKKLLDDTSKISEELIEINEDIEKNQSLVDRLLANTGKVLNLPITGFIGNPIYHFRMWLVDRDHDLAESLRVKKELVELRLMELKLEQQQSPDKDLSKQVRYYEDKLAGLEYEIEKLEK